MSNEYLFPVEARRRDFLGAVAALTATGLVGRSGRAAKPRRSPLPWAAVPTYTLDENWGKLPAGMKYGFGCAIVVDSQDRVFVTRARPAPASPSSTRTASCSKPGARSSPRTSASRPSRSSPPPTACTGARRATTEFLYWTENVAGAKDGPKIGARVYKTDMQGQGAVHDRQRRQGSRPRRRSSTSPTRPTWRSAANGDIYVVDGYGSQLLYRFDKNFKHIKTIGGPGKEHGKFNTCHGVWVSTLRQGAGSLHRRPRQQPHRDLLAGAGVQADACPTSACRAASTSTTASSTSRNWVRA